MPSTRQILDSLNVWVILAIALVTQPDPASAQNRAYRIDVVPSTGTSVDGTEEFGIGLSAHANLTESGDILFDMHGFGPVRWSGDTVTVVAASGQTAPGTGGEVFGFYPSFLSRPNNNGDVTFISEIGPNFTFEDHGLWAGQAGQLELIARNGDPAPGAPGLIFLSLSNRPVYDLANGGIYGGSLNDAGDLVFRAVIGDPLACIPDCGQQFLQEGLWRHSANGLEPFVQSSDPAPGLDGESFLGFPFYVLNDAGDVVFVASTISFAPGSGFGDGIWAGQAGSLRPVAVRGQVAPGTDGLTFSAFRSGWFSDPLTSTITLPHEPPGPATNAAGDIGFYAGIEPFGSDGIWLERGGQLELVARLGDPAPGTAGAVFASMFFSKMDMNEAGQLAFTAVFNTPETGGHGLWVGDSDALNLIVTTDDEAPGIDPAPFLGFNMLDVNLSGDVAFEGSIADWQWGRQTQGVWVGGSDGVSSVLQEGHAIEVAPGDVRLVSTVNLSSLLFSDNGAARAMNDAGQISLFATGLAHGTLLIATPIDPAAPNNPPIAEAGPDQTVLETEFFTLDAAGTTDAEGTPLFFSWSADGVPLGNGPRINIRASNPGIDLDPGIYTVTVTVTDQQGLSGTDTMVLNVGAVNNPPVADAGADQTVSHTQSVQLDGTGSSDPDGDTLSYLWELNGATIANTATATVGPLSAGGNTITLTVTDPAGASSSDIVQIFGANSLPVADAGPDQSLPVLATTSLDGTGSSDPDGEPLTYQWRIANTLIATGPTPTVGPFGEGSHAITLRVTDTLGSVSHDFLILTVTNAAPVADAGPDQSLPVLSTTALNGNGSSDPEGGALTYQWSLGGTQIASGPTPTVGPFSEGLQTITLTVTDTSGASGTDTLVLTVTNAPPVADAGADATIQDVDTVTLDGGGSSDPEGGALAYQWELGGTVIATDVAPTVGPFPAGPQTITLTVTDSEGATASDNVAITVLVSGPVADPDTVAHLPLDEGSGTTAADIGDLNNDGTLQNGAQFDAATADGSASSVRFDGSNDYIDLGNFDVAGSGLTMAAWFNADRFPGSYRDPRLISKASSKRSSRHVFMLGTIRVGSATRLRARVRVDGSTKTLVASSGNLQTGVWHHAAATFDGSRLRLYLDGIEVGSRSAEGTLAVDPSKRVAVGAQPPGAGGKRFDGLIDDVRILSRAMSAAEVSQIGAGGS